MTVSWDRRCGRMAPMRANHSFLEDPDRSSPLREALLDLAYDAHSYLRHHARSAVRVSAALLVAASLAACGPSSSVPCGTAATVQPLSQEVRSGLPTQPGRYPIVPDALGRDVQRVYHFAGRRPGDPASVQNDASASLIRLAQGASTARYNCEAANLSPRPG